MDKELYYEIITALEKLDEVYRHIDNAMPLATGHSYVQDVLEVAQRNLSMAKMRLDVASDITETM